jgi:hypothetical protein
MRAQSTPERARIPIPFLYDIGYFCCQPIRDDSVKPMGCDIVVSSDTLGDFI